MKESFLKGKNEDIFSEGKKTFFQLWDFRSERRPSIHGSRSARPPPSPVTARGDWASITPGALFETPTRVLPGRLLLNSSFPSPSIPMQDQFCALRLVFSTTDFILVFLVQILKVLIILKVFGRETLFNHSFLTSTFNSNKFFFPQKVSAVGDFGFCWRWKWVCVSPLAPIAFRLDGNSAISDSTEFSLGQIKIASQCVQILRRR